MTEYFPAEHPVQLVAPEDEYRPAGHVVHSEAEFAPITAEYIPAGHDVHTADDVLPEMKE